MTYQSLDKSWSPQSVLDAGSEALWSPVLHQDKILKPSTQRVVRGYQWEPVNHMVASCAVLGYRLF